VVFTVPEQIATISYQNKRELYGILFRAAAETLRTIATDPKHLGVEIGFFAVLHTWGSNLLHHPHLHCGVTGGGLSADGTEWVSCRAGFFLPVRVLSQHRSLRSKYSATAELFPQHLAWPQADSFRSDSIAERRRARISASLQPIAESNMA
jgi:hypothetical protein